jgi:hypothetical protein
VKAKNETKKLNPATFNWKVAGLIVIKVVGIDGLEPPTLCL